MKTDSSQSSSSVSATITRPALGQGGALGRLYDANSDKLLSETLLTTDQPPPEFVETKSLNDKGYTTRVSDSIEDRHRSFDLSADVSASIICGTIAEGWRGEYLSRGSTKPRGPQVSGLWTLQTRRDSLNLGAAMSKCVNPAALTTVGATHVVCGIKWGSQALVTARPDFSNRSNSGRIQAMSGSDATADLEATSQTLSRCIRAFEGVESDEGPVWDEEIKRAMTMLNLSFSGDGIDRIEQAPTCSAEVSSFLTQVGSSLRAARGCTEIPLFFELRPIENIARGFGVKLDKVPIVYQLDLSVIHECIQLLAELDRVHGEFTDYHERLEQHKDCFPARYLRTISRLPSSRGENRDSFEDNFRKTVRKIRSGMPSMSEELSDIYEKADDNKYPTGYPNILTKYDRKLSLVKRLKEEGAEYFQHEKFSVDDALKGSGHSDTYVLHYTDATTQYTNWNDHYNSVMEILIGKKARVLVVDYDAGEPKELKAATLEYWAQGKHVCHDVVGYKKEPNLKCQLQWRPAESKMSLSTAPPAPASKQPLRIFCPGWNCSDSSRSTWICRGCSDLVYYVSTDGYAYCKCGKHLPSDALFMCSNATHGPIYQPYPQNLLHRHLKDSGQHEVYNVLVVGETGAGKSTFINAFHNLIQYNTFDEALKDGEPSQFAIPFSVQYRRKDDTDVHFIAGPQSQTGGEVHSTTGESATRESMVYNFETTGGKIIRLIDTPGIGDTRGPNQDRKNVQEILLGLESTENISAILILLKSNASRLTPTFKFCMLELLRHLHRSAAQNILFGFTYSDPTRVFTTGTQAAGPLAAILGSLDVGIALGNENQYYFDLEWLRYLVVSRNERKELPGKAHFEQMWQASAEQMDRLISRVVQLQTHKVKETLTFNRVRNILEGMMKPLTKFSSVMKESQLNLKKINDELADLDLEDKDLAKRLEELKVSITVAVRYNLSSPKIVCSHTECSPLKEEEGDRRGILAHSACHENCDLDAPDEVVGHENVRVCYAFRRWLVVYGYDCYKCKHPWKTHMRISYELRNEERLVEDQGILEKIGGNQDTRSKVEATKSAASSLVMEIEEEWQQIKRAQASFGFYLRENAITVDNDATLWYLDYQIQLAKGENDHAACRDFEEQKKAYTEYLNELSKSIKERPETRPDALKVDEIIDQLKVMKIFGKYLTESLDKTGPASRICQVLTLPCRHKKKESSSGWKWFWGSSAAENFWNQPSD